MRIAFVGVAHHHYPLYLQPVLDAGDHTVVGIADPTPGVARDEPPVSRLRSRSPVA
jgi:hypothetical protein